MGMYLPSHACFQCMIKAICLSNGFGEYAKGKYLSIAETNIFLLVKINRTRQVSYTLNNFDVLVGRLCIDLFCLWFICNAIKDVKNSWANKVDSSVCADQFEALTYSPPRETPRANSQASRRAFELLKIISIKFLPLEKLSTYWPSFKT